MDGICECKRGLVEKGDKCIVPPVVRPQPKKRKLFLFLSMPYITDGKKTKGGWIGNLISGIGNKMKKGFFYNRLVVKE